MALNVKRVTELAFNVEDRPGMLADITRHLAEAGINLVALLAWSEGGGRARVGCVAEDVGKLKALAAQFGIEVREHTLFLLEGEDRVGALVELATELGNAGVNITGVNACANFGRYTCLLRVADEDVEKAGAVLTHLT